MEDKVRLIKIFASLMAGAAFVIGFLLIWTYCSSIGYFPVGLTAADFFIFSFLSFTFGFLYLAFSAFIFGASALLYPLHKISYDFCFFLVSKFKLVRGFAYNPKRSIPTLSFRPVQKVYFILFLMLNFIVVAIFGFGDPFNRTIFDSIIVIFFMWSGLQFTCSKFKKGRDGTLRSQVIILVFALLFPLLTDYVFRAHIVDATLRYAGVSRMNVKIALSGEYGDLVSQITKADPSYKSDAIAVYNGNVLLQGLGAFNVFDINGWRFVVPMENSTVSYEAPYRENQYCSSQPC